MKRKNICVLLSCILSSTLLSCNNGGEVSSQIESSSSIDFNCNVFANEYEDMVEITDCDAYQGDVATNLPVKNGTIKSPFYTLKINDVDIPVYASRTTNTIHSFAYVDVEIDDSNKDFLLNVAINTLEKSNVLKKKNSQVVVLPESKKVTGEIVENSIFANINDYGSYSFAFNNKQDEALTLFVAKKENTDELFNDKEIVYFEPNDYSTSNQTILDDENKVYYFKKGKYKIDRIMIPSNSILYLEKGAYLEVYPNTETYAMKNAGTENIKVLGRGTIDFSPCCGGEVPEGYHNNKGGLVFSDVTNIEFSGVTVINSQTWTLCMNNCINVDIHDCLFLGYRVYSDGIMLSDCKNALVHDNFIRTGDDAFETKSTTSNGLTENVTFENNAAWTDKAVAYGCIYESNHDTRDVHFKNCSVGFAMGTWSNHLGCCVIQLGNRIGAVIENITFDNIEIYNSSNPGLMNVYIGGSGGRGAGYGIVKNIYFSNITAHRNYGAYLNLRTYDNVNCFIYDLYLDNIVANDVMLTKDNYQTDGYITDNVVGGYDYRRLKINTLM